MTPPKPEPPEGTPPKKPRKPTIRGAKESSEMDLWDFDGDAPAPPAAPVVPAPAAPPRSSEGVPPPKQRTKSVQQVPRTLAKEDKPAPIDRAPRRPGASKAHSQPFELRKKVSDDIGELDSGWDVPGAAEPEPAAREETVKPVRPEPEPQPAEERVPQPEILSPVREDLEEEFAAPPAKDGEDSAAASGKPSAALEIGAIRERLGLSKMEKIGLGVLAAVLIISGVTIFAITRSRLALPPDKPTHPHYPVKGSLVTIREASTFWRKPIAGKDSVRRDTQLIPVLKAEVEGGPCALRVFFRDDKGEIVGDAVTRTTGTGTVEISATGGLEDIGMHASFRTGQTGLWKVEVFEAPSADSPRQDFKKLIESPVSTDLQL